MVLGAYFSSKRTVGSEEMYPLKHSFIVTVTRYALIKMIKKI